MKIFREKQLHAKMTHLHWTCTANIIGILSLLEDYPTREIPPPTGYGGIVPKNDEWGIVRTPADQRRLSYATFSR